jgi:hypothetical protein
MNKPTHPSLRCKAHWQNAHSQRYNQILPKSLSARPTPPPDRDSAAKMKDNSLKINNETLTKCINHWADSANFKGFTFNKNCSGLTGKRFEMPNASYTNR